MHIKKYNLMAVRLNNKLVMLKNFRCFGHLVHGGDVQCTMAEGSCGRRPGRPRLFGGGSESNSVVQLRRLAGRPLQFGGGGEAVP